MPDLIPTDGMREEAQRYRAWKAEGRRGGTAVAARRAAQILSGDPLSEQTVITMAAWFARHEVDKQAEGFRPGEEGYPSPGRVAWAAWGGDPGQRWSTAKADTIKAQSERTIPMAEVQGRPYPNEHAARLKEPGQFDEFRRENDAGGPGVDFIYGIKDGVSELQAVRFDAKQHTPAQAKKWLEDNNYDAIEFEEATGDRGLTPDMSASDALLYEALEDIAEELGEFSQEKAHYMPESPFADKGMKCENCAFFEGPAACEIVEGEIKAGALCKFWIIPQAKLAPFSPAPHVMSDVELRSRFKDGLVFKREFNLTAVAQEEGSGIRFEFSSEEPVQRWFGAEVLSHAPGAADLTRLRSGGLHLWNHDPNVVLGRITNCDIGANRKGWVETKWSPNTLEPGSEERKRRVDIEAGITTNASFLYEIREAVDMGEDRILVTKWSPLEASTVPIPADITVGHSESAQGADRSQPPIAPPVVEQQPEAPPLAAVGSRAAEATLDVKLPPTSPTIMTVETPPNAEEAVRSAVASAATAERLRVTSISRMCKTHNMPETLADELISNGRSLEEAQAIVLEKLGCSSRELQPGGVHMETQAEIGMGKRDLARYDPIKLLRYLAEPNSRQWRDEAGFELECSAAASAKSTLATRGEMIPYDWMKAPGYARRDQTVGTFNQGGALVGTELLSASFIDLLRNQSALLGAGVTLITGLTQNVEIPRRTGSSQHYWVGETDTLPKSTQTFGSITSTPKRIGVRVGVSKLSLLQANPDLDALTRNDMNLQLALGYDAAGFYGTGSSYQPLGLANVTGIGGAGISMSGGVDALYPASLGGGTHNTGSYSNFTRMRASTYAGNVDVANAVYWMNGVTKSGCEETLRAASAGSDYIIDNQGRIGEYRVRMTNQVLTNDVFYGVAPDLVLLTWGGLDVVVDNLTELAAGNVVFNMTQHVDWVCRRPTSFSRIS